MSFGSCRIRGPDAPGNLGTLLALDHANVILTLQVQPELRAVAEIPAEPNGGIGRDPRRRLRMSVIRPDGTPISSDRRFALSFRAAISRFRKRPGCTTGVIAFNLGLSIESDVTRESQLTSLRAKRSNPSCRKDRLDCHVAALLAMTIEVPVGR